MRINRTMGRCGLAWAGLALVGLTAGCGEDAAKGDAGGGGSATKLAIVPGGPHPYFEPMKGALSDAKAKFKLADTAYRFPQSFDLTKQNEVISSLAAQGYNAFAIFPDDANGSNGTIEELAANGAAAVTVGACTKEPSEALFCLATDVAKSAEIGTRELIREIGGKGRIAHLTGLLADPNTKLRDAAVKKAVAEAGAAVELVQTLTDIDSPEAADKAVNNLLAARGDKLDGIISTAYNPSVAAAEALSKETGRKIALVGIDDDAKLVKAIESGAASGTMVQNPYGQAYLAAYVLNEVVSKGCEKKGDAPFAIDSGTLFVSADNLASYKEQLRAITAEQIETFGTRYLQCQS
jgi:ribose transport system substrate-binding protein